MTHTSVASVVTGSVPQTSEEGYIHRAPSGAGHFVKMIHNGIAYELLQAYAEGLDIGSHANSPQVAEAYRCDLKIGDIADVWHCGSVVSSWQLGLTAMALLSSYTGQVQDSGEGRWTITTAVEAAVPAAILSAALYTRCRLRQEHTGVEKV